jgi:hypothetical protein
LRVACGDLWNGGNVEARLVALNDDIELAYHAGVSSSSILACPAKALQTGRYPHPRR